jgi:O-antigen/teichoic acid export membrane protein
MHDVKTELDINKTFKVLLIAGGASWIPYVIHNAGSYLGPLAVFGSNGASQAGVYFIAYSIFIAFSAILSVLFTMAYPTLSAMQDGRKRLTWRITKMTLIISLPLSSSFIFYSKQIMQFFGAEYVSGSTSLEILLLSTLPIILITGINTLVNSYGQYRQVLVIGIATNIPSAAFYFVFTPIFNNGIGAAISYTFGAFIGLIVSVFVSKQIEMKIYWKEIVLIFALPSAFAFMLSYFQVYYGVGIFLTLALSYLVLLRLHIITKTDIDDSFALIPSSIARPVITVWNGFFNRSNKPK